MEGHVVPARLTQMRCSTAISPIAPSRREELAGVRSAKALTLTARTVI